MEINFETGEEIWTREYNNFRSLDDFISAKLMGETIGASENVIAFIPENLDPTKVFAATELEQIFKNDTFQFINGIPKGELESIYRSGEVGQQAVYDIIKKTAKEAVGDTKGIEPQAEKLQSSFEENGILNSRSSVFSISTCFDANGKQIGAELYSSKAGTLIKRPENTVSSKLVVRAAIENTMNEIDSGRRNSCANETRKKDSFMKSQEKRKQVNSQINLISLKERIAQKKAILEQRTTKSNVQSKNKLQEKCKEGVRYEI